jgi:hypothetical protein
MQKKLRIKVGFIWNVLVVIATIATVLVAIFNNSFEKVGNLFLLPLAYLISLFIVRQVFYKQSGLALIILQSIMLCRYIVGPLLFAFDNEYTGITVNGANYETAVWYIVYELFAVSVAMWAFIKIKISNNKHELKRIKPKYQLLTIKRNTRIRYFTIITLVFWMFIVATSSKLRGNLFNFRLLTREDLGFTSYISSQEYNLDIPGAYKVFFSIGLIVLLVLLVELLARRKSMPKSIKAVLIIVVLIGFVSSMWTNGFAVSRWGMLISVIIAIFVLIYYFPNKKKFIINNGIIAILAVIIVGSLLKSISHGYTNYTVTDSTSRYITAEYFDEYFSGVAPVANGNVVSDYYGSTRTIKNLFADTIFNFPYAMKILGINVESVSNELFRSFTGHYDLIMPTISQGLLQFGPIFCPLYSVLLVLLAFSMDNRLTHEESLYKKIFYVVLVFWTSLFMAVNINIIEANIWYAVFGIWLVSIEEKFKLEM